MTSARLTPSAIALLRRLPETWLDWRDADLDGDAADAWRELHAQGLVELRIMPPPDPGRRASRIGRELDDKIDRRTEVRRNGAGGLRLHRIGGSR